MCVGDRESDRGRDKDAECTQSILATGGGEMGKVMVHQLDRTGETEENLP